MKVVDKGLKSFFAFKVYQKVIYNYMLIKQNDDLEKELREFKQKTDDEKSRELIKVISIVVLSDDDINRLISVVHNDDGVCVKNSIQNKKYSEIMQMIMFSLLYYSNVDIDFFLSMKS